MSAITIKTRKPGGGRKPLPGNTGRSAKVSCRVSNPLMACIEHDAKTKNATISETVNNALVAHYSHHLPPAKPENYEPVGGEDVD